MQCPLNVQLFRLWKLHSLKRANMHHMHTRSVSMLMQSFEAKDKYNLPMMALSCRSLLTHGDSLFKHAHTHTHTHIHAPTHTHTHQWNENTHCIVIN